MTLTAETLMNDRPLLPRQLAERWGCSERHVRNLIAAGQLRHFRLGGRLLRIPASAVEEYERRQSVEAVSKTLPSSPAEAASPAVRRRRPERSLMRALARGKAEL